MLAANPLASAETSASGADAAIDVCRLDAQWIKLSEPTMGFTRYMVINHIQCVSKPRSSISEKLSNIVLEEGTKIRL